MEKNRAIYLLIVILVLWNIVLTITLSNVQINNNSSSNTMIKNVTISGYASDITKVVENIKTSNVVVDGFNNFGSGFIYGQDDELVYVVTAYHIVSDSPTITIVLDNNQRHFASLVAYDIYSDLALLSYEKDVEVTSVTLGDATLLKEGEFVYMMGTPSNIELADSISLGIVSSSLRTITNSIKTDGIAHEYYLQDIQLSSNISSGFSGGAVYNNAGEVVGVVTMSSKSAEVFATPINEVNKFVENGLSADPLEISPLNIKGSFIREMELYTKNVLGINLEVNDGFYVDEVKVNSILRETGIKKGDIIYAVNDKELNDYEDYLNIKYSDLNELKIIVFREGETIELMGETND